MFTVSLPCSKATHGSEQTPNSQVQHSRPAQAALLTTDWSMVSSEEASSSHPSPQFTFFLGPDASRLFVWDTLSPQPIPPGSLLPQETRPPLTRQKLCTAPMLGCFELLFNTWFKISPFLSFYLVSESRLGTPQGAGTVSNSSMSPLADSRCSINVH